MFDYTEFLIHRRKEMPALEFLNTILNQLSIIFDSSPQLIAILIFLAFGYSSMKQFINDSFPFGFYEFALKSWLMTRSAISDNTLAYMSSNI